MVEIGSVVSSPLFSIFSLAAILVGSRDHRTQFWKGAIQGLFHQSLVAIGPVISEEKLCEFPIGSYVKLSSAVGAILVEEPDIFLEENHPMTISSTFSSY